MSDFVQQQNSVCDFGSSDSWVVLSPIEQSIKQKIETVGTPLKDWDINIYRGVLTGCNEAFIINTEKRDEILANCQTDDERTRTAELIRPILRGRDIKRYAYEWAELWLIATFPSRHYNIDEYPAIKQYLLSFGIERLEQTGKIHIVNGEKVKARKRTSNKWFETQDSISYWEDFSKPKVMWKIIGCNINFCFDEKQLICNNAVDIMTGDRDSLIQFVGLMNSKLFDWYLKLTTEAEVQGGGIQLYVTTLEKTLLKLDFQQPLTDIVYQRIHNQVTDATVDMAVFEAYNLTLEEQAFIMQDKRVNKNREE
ncbi:type II restriction endonuclease [Prevotella intermedia]|nr:type II restriction endonuclease [Prevotella intermedia]